MIFRNITYVALANKMADTCVRLHQTRVQARPVSGLGKMIAQCTRIAYVVHGKKIMSCNRLLKTGCNNVVGATLFLVVNNIGQYCSA